MVSIWSLHIIRMGQYGLINDYLNLPKERQKQYLLGLYFGIIVGSKING